jgi:hypothetical protein
MSVSRQGGCPSLNTEHTGSLTLLEFAAVVFGEIDLPAEGGMSAERLAYLEHAAEHEVAVAPQLHMQIDKS